MKKRHLEIILDSLKPHPKPKPHLEQYTIEGKLASEILFFAKEDILNQISINAEDLKALKALLDSLDGSTDGEVNLQNALLKLLDRVDKLEEDNKSIRSDLTNCQTNITNIGNNVKVNSDNLNAIFECMTNMKDAISLAESKFKIIGTTTNTTNDTTSNEDNAL